MVKLTKYSCPWELLKVSYIMTVHCRTIKLWKEHSIIMISHITIPTDRLLHSETIYIILFGPSANNYNWIVQTFQSPRHYFPLTKMFYHHAYASFKLSSKYGTITLSLPYPIILRRRRTIRIFLRIKDTKWT